MSKNKKAILLTVDVEDWFQVENFKPWIPFSTWDSSELRVEDNTKRLLDLFDSIPGVSIHTTFFVLGWIAERLPNLVKLIHQRGHEVASHGFYHNLCNQETLDQLKSDLTDSKKLLEDIIGAPIYGYRAPNFSVSNDILKIIEDSGYSYDSSYNSLQFNPRYGRLDLSNAEKKGIVYQISDTFYEIPISNLAINKGKRVIPWGGGGYFRLFPLIVFISGVQSILKKELSYVFYMHPWEIDSKQPKVNEASFFLRFRHYLNLHKTEEKLKNLINFFQKMKFISCKEILNL